MSYLSSAQRFSREYVFCILITFTHAFIIPCAQLGEFWYLYAFAAGSDVLGSYGDTHKFSSVCPWSKFDRQAFKECILSGFYWPWEFSWMNLLHVENWGICVVSSQVFVLESREYSFSRELCILPMLCNPRCIIQWVFIFICCGVWRISVMAAMVIKWSKFDSRSRLYWAWECAWTHL